MADANHKARPPVTERFVTIQQFRRDRPGDSWHYNQESPLVPWIRLSGLWLEQVGFKAQQRVRIQVRKGKLVITPA
jgi:toxic protein SymE